MKLTKYEQEICEKFSAYDETGHVHCSACPLAIDTRYLVCYSTIDGRTKEAKQLKRFMYKKEWEERNELRGFKSV